MRRMLTDKTVAALKTNKKSQEFRDMLLPGFGVRDLPLFGGPVVKLEHGV